MAKTTKKGVMATAAAKKGPLWKNDLMLVVMGSGVVIKFKSHDAAQAFVKDIEKLLAGK